MLIALNVNNKEEVKDLIKKAVITGGSTYMEPKDHGMMFQHSFSDLDGHQWELFYMDETAIPKE